MAKSVLFGGTAADYVSTDDVNLLDADTAHLEQGLGKWVDTGGSDGHPSIGATITPKFGTKHGINIGSPTKPFVKWGTPFNGGMPAVAGKTYTFSAWVSASVASKVNLEVFFLDVGDANIGTGASQTDTLVIDSFEVQGSVTALAPVNTTQIWCQLWWVDVDGSSSPPAGIEAYWDAVLVAEGSDDTFVPSLDVQGTLGETVDPSAMPIVYSAGTPLTVGKSWAGEGLRYTRYDGAVGVGPIVADFFPDDIPA